MSTLKAIKISIPIGRYFIYAAVFFETLISSIITTKRKRTITAPTYTRIRIIDRNSAPRSSHKTADKKNEKTKSVINKVMNAVKDKLSPEFINRLDEILFFSKLGKSHVASIVEIQLNYLKNRLLLNNYSIVWDEKVCDTIALKGYNPEYGARPIKREIRDVVEDKISALIINNNIKDGSVIRIEVVDNNIEVNLV